MTSRLSEVAFDLVDSLSAEAKRELLIGPVEPRTSRFSSPNKKKETSWDALTKARWKAKLFSDAATARGLRVIRTREPTEKLITVDLAKAQGLGDAEVFYRLNIYVERDLQSLHGGSEAVAPALFPFHYPNGFYRLPNGAALIEFKGIALHPVAATRLVVRVEICLQVDQVISRPESSNLPAPDFSL